MAARPATLLAALAVVLAAAALLVALRRPEAAALDEGEAETAEAEEAEELAHLMAFVQRYAEKLYLAGTNDHAALAQFYVEELEETFEGVAAGGYVEEGRDVAELVETVVDPALEGVEHAVAAEALSADAAGEARARALFEARYAALVRACNSCHETTGHGYVRIVVPEGSSFPNQDFRPAGEERMADGR
jgi:hypothetical protein